MKLVVASRNGISQVDTETNIVTPFFEDSLPEAWDAYGISWNHEGLFVIVRVQGGLSLERVLIYNKKLERVGEMVVGQDQLRDAHQTMWHDDKLWIVSSGLNQVVCIPENQFDTTIWIPEEGEKGDRNHINSIWFPPDEDKVYLVAHNFQKGSEIWEFTYPGLDLIQKTKMGFQAHNVAKVNGKLMTLSSREGKIIMDDESKKIGEYYGRGLAISKDRIFIGQSAIIPDRNDRKLSSQGAVLIYDKDLNFIKKIIINQGEVREVRILDEPDEAHHLKPWLTK